MKIRFLHTVETQRASICGYAPIVSTIITAKKLGATRAELLKYTTSGDITGDHSSVGLRGDRVPEVVFADLMP